MNHLSIEKKWQKKWADLGKTRPSSKKKFFLIFAYPGISGFLHVGHMRGYTLSDMFCRYKRMNDFEVLFPVGTHASGNHAIAFAKKVQNKDEKWIEYLKKNGCPDSKIKQMTTADNIIDYFNNVYVEDYWKKFGFICDWDRFTCTSYPDYQKFIQWQFKKLMEKDLLIQKPYFATFCPNCGPVAVDPSETDISRGGNAEKNEYTILKFKFGDDFLVAATLRPETVYGQTNLWMNPKADYVKVSVEGENWIMSGSAAEKLAYQKDDVEVIDKVKAVDYIGKMALAPAINKDIIILPAPFVDPEVGSGIVTSVPSDAPYDYIALKDLKKDKAALKFGLDKIELIPIIETKGYGKFPAVDICKKLKITSLKDEEKLEQATKEIYKAGFHTGKLADICGEYKGKSVIEAKELIKQALIEEKSADIFHDLSEEVVCRCGENVIIKRIDDQWFIKYSDQKVTDLSKKQAEKMWVLPEDYARNFPNVLDWFQDRACVRLGNWTGTPLPFDEKWIVEPIADSTLYPLYYLVSPYVNSKQIKKEQLTESFFDFIYLDKGDAKTVAKETGIDKSLVEQIHKDVQYYYPLDINLGGKDHQTVHFPVFLMNHVGVLDKKYWPKGIIVNYWITGKGSKISKSKGGAEPIPGAIEKYSVDALRLYYAHIGSPFVDVVWDQDVVFNYKSSIERIYKLVDELLKCKGNKSQIDYWLASKMNFAVESVTESFEKFNIRVAATKLYYEIYDAFRWYQRRGGCDKETIQKSLMTWAKLMCPITPHLAEEIWSKFDDKLVSVVDWPNAGKINAEPDAVESIIEGIVNDARNVFALSKLDTPKELTVFVADQWKFDLFIKLRKSLGVTRNIGEIMKEVLADDSLRKHGKDVSKLIQSVVKDPSKIPQMIFSHKKEKQILSEAKEFLETALDVKITVLNSSESKEQKAAAGMPGKPALLVK